MHRTKATVRRERFEPFAPTRSSGPRRRSIALRFDGAGAGQPGVSQSTRDAEE